MTLDDGSARPWRVRDPVHVSVYEKSGILFQRLLLDRVVRQVQLFKV
ncbi:hypothetical protein [Diaminobutyricibacter sp. McL0608]